MKKRILSLIAAVICLGTLCSCGQDIAKEAAEKGKSFFDSGEYETAAKAFGVAIDNGSKDEETAFLYNICLSYYQADKAYKAGDLETTKKILDGIDAKYEDYGIKEVILTLKNDVDKSFEAKAKLEDVANKMAANDYAAATAVIEGIDITKLSEEEVASLNGLKTTIAEAQARAAEEAQKAQQEKPAVQPENKPSKPAATQSKPASSQQKPASKPAAQPKPAAPAINVNVANDAYIYPTDSKLLTVEQLRTLSANDLALIRNEIYARRGHIFTRAAYQNYFGQKTWYSATKTVFWGELNDIERQNVMLIKRYESGELK